MAAVASGPTRNAAPIATSRAERDTPTADESYERSRDTSTLAANDSPSGVRTTHGPTCRARARTRATSPTSSEGTSSERLALWDTEPSQ